MTSLRSNTVEFRIDAMNDVVIAKPHWNIVTESDCKNWYQQFENYFTSLGRDQVDLIVVLDDFALDRRITSVWGKYRAQMIQTFTRYSVRVHASLHASTAAHTSGALYGAASDEAPDMAAALERIRYRRAHPSAPIKIRS